MSTTHVVKQGECLSSIALRYGFSDYRTIYEHPDNAAFKRKRPNPNVIHPGDTLVIPDKKSPLQAECTTGKRHRLTFERVRVLARMAVLEDDDHPIADAPYELWIEGKKQDGRTDENGLLEESLPPDLPEARLVLPERGLEIELRFGHLDPIEEVTGLQARLNNLGFWCGEVDGILGPLTRSAITSFQASRGLVPSGEPDGPTRDLLTKAHDGG